jgi:hypothetical protein
MPGGSLSNSNPDRAIVNRYLGQQNWHIRHFAAQTLELSIAVSCLVPRADLPVDWDLTI